MPLYPKAWVFCALVFLVLEGGCYLRFWPTQLARSFNLIAHLCAAWGMPPLSLSVSILFTFAWCTVMLPRMSCVEFLLGRDFQLWRLSVCLSFGYFFPSPSFPWGGRTDVNNVRHNICWKLIKVCIQVLVWIEGCLFFFFFKFVVFKTSSYFKLWTVVWET